MKKFKKIIFAFLALFTLTTITPNTVNAWVKPCSPTATVTLTASEGWVTLYHCSSRGLNRNVNINVNAASLNGLRLADAQIRMIGKDGRVLWTGKVPNDNQFHKFWCGSDVYKIQVRIPNGAGSVYIKPA